ncbi:MAG: adenylate kinase [Solirubrobacteraceae bacterium]|nr:adenylate kinase [Solirubrobacteraceae bacterium]
MPGSRIPRHHESGPSHSIALMSELNLILLGPPGAGKGTQAERLQEDFPLAYVATGDILRQAVADETDLGREAKAYMDRGELVPDDVIIGVILERLAGDSDDGFLLDGFPRTVAQAEALDTALAEREKQLSAVLLIDVPPDDIVRRLSGRRVCEKGHVYHVEHNPPKEDGVCDVDGTALRQRDDDREETIRKRLDVYRDQTSPLIDYYDDRDLLRRFDGTRNPTEVHDHLRATIATLRMEETA